MAEKRDTVFVIASSAFGDQKELGGNLMRSFFSALAESEEKPRQIVFTNMGIFFTTEGSEVLSSLQSLAEAGVDIRSCDTALEYLGLREKLRVGEPITMPEMVASLTSGAAVVRL
jgi:intracellular sulfur oxidation DsrE/DsrF family protein